VQQVFAFIADTLRRRLWWLYFLVVAALAVVLSIQGVSWTSIIVIALILIFAGAAAFVLKSVLAAMTGTAQPKRTDDAR
jgi:FtsH-binding integral membrane protein